LSERRAITLLTAGALAGLAAAAAGLLAQNREASVLPDGAVAAVNGTAVRRVDYDRAVEALATDRRSAVDDADRRHVLDRLVDEELLVQRALELGLARQDRRVRGDLVAAVIESVTAGVDQREPDAAELRAFFDANRDYFARPGRLHVEQVFARSRGDADGDALARARDAAARLRDGAAAADVQHALGDAPVARLPDAPLPEAKLREYLGPAAVLALAALAPGEVAEPVRAAGGYHVLRLVAREPTRTPELAEVEAELRAEWRRRAGDEALRAYLDELRRRAAIAVAGSLP
jgi:parvulin-like peptidyl-prolyl isomerase